MTDPARALPEITTERLFLRAFIDADASSVERLAGAREVADTTLNIPHPYPEGGALTWIREHEPAWTSGERLSLAICLLDNPRDIIGAVSLAIRSMHAHAELGYWIGLPWWRQGFATEASRAIVNYGFTELGLHRVHARHFVRNPASGRVMTKLGMQFEGRNRDAYRRWERFEDVDVYSVLEHEWKRIP